MKEKHVLVLQFLEEFGAYKSYAEIMHIAGLKHPSAAKNVLIDLEKWGYILLHKDKKVQVINKRPDEISKDQYIQKLEMENARMTRLLNNIIAEYKKIIE